MAKDDKKQNTLTDADITTDRPTGRRTFLGAMGAAGVGAGLVAAGAARAQSITDSDNGSWTDDGGCGRGSGGFYTGVTDQDDGSTGTDLGGQGRGRPYC